MADDVKVLREFIVDVDTYDGASPGVMVSVVYTLAKRMADMIEREEAKAEAQANFEKVAGIRPYSEFRAELLGAPTPDALQAAEDRGWNEALDKAREMMSARGMTSAEALCAALHRPSKEV